MGQRGRAVTIDDFLPKTQAGFRAMQVAAAVPFDFEKLTTPMDWRVAAATLMGVVDNRDYFPSGKWATIQHMLVLAEAEAER